MVFQCCARGWAWKGCSLSSGGERHRWPFDVQELPGSIFYLMPGNDPADGCQELGGSVQKKGGPPSFFVHYPLQEFIMITGHKERAMDDDFSCSPLKASQAVNLCSAYILVGYSYAVHAYSRIGLM